MRKCLVIISVTNANKSLGPSSSCVKKISRKEDPSQLVSVGCIADNGNFVETMRMKKCWGFSSVDRTVGNPEGGCIINATKEFCLRKHPWLEAASGRKHPRNMRRPVEHRTQNCIPGRRCMGSWLSSEQKTDHPRWAEPEIRTE